MSKNYPIIKSNQIEDESLPRFLSKSTIFFGPPGCGKTSLLVATALWHMNDYERYSNAVNKIKELNGLGYQYQIPTQEHIVFSENDIEGNYPLGAGKKSYDFDPHKFMIPNEEFDFDLIIPYGIYVHSEMQVVLNSYKYKEIPEYVYTAHQNRRHVHLLYYGDAQRIAQIAAGIRELYQSFVRPIKLVFNYDKNGNCISTRFIYMEFDSDAAAERFTEENGGSDQYETPRFLAHGSVKSYIFPGDIRGCYNGYENEKLFLPDKTVSQKPLSTDHSDHSNKFIKIKKEKSA